LLPRKCCLAARNVRIFQVDNFRLRTQ
jgi:hypothetical protein